MFCSGQVGRIKVRRLGAYGVKAPAPIVYTQHTHNLMSVKSFVINLLTLSIASS